MKPHSTSPRRRTSVFVSITIVMAIPDVTIVHAALRRMTDILGAASDPIGSRSDTLAPSPPDV